MGAPPVWRHDPRIALYRQPLTEEDGNLISKQEGKFFLLYVNAFVVDDLIR